MKMGRFSNAIGVWDLKVQGVDFVLKPTMSDVKLFRNILTENMKHQSKLFDKVNDFMFQLIKKEYPEETDQEVKEFIEINTNVLFEEALVAFKWTTREQLEKNKQDSLEDLKKRMSNA